MSIEQGLDAETLGLMMAGLTEYLTDALPLDRQLELDHEDICPEDTVRAMSTDLGIQLVFVPEAYGGMGGGAMDSYLLCEVMARKGGRAANAEGRRCLCNALLAAADLPQVRPNGYVEPPIVTSGEDFSAVAALSGPGTGGSYSANDVIGHLRSGLAAFATVHTGLRAATGE